MRYANFRTMVVVLLFICVQCTKTSKLSEGSQVVKSYYKESNTEKEGKLVVSHRNLYDEYTSWGVATVSIVKISMSDRVIFEDTIEFYSPTNFKQICYNDSIFYVLLNTNDAIVGSAYDVVRCEKGKGTHLKMSVSPFVIQDIDNDGVIEMVEIPISEGCAEGYCYYTPYIIYKMGSQCVRDTVLEDKLNKWRYGFIPSSSDSLIQDDVAYHHPKFFSAADICYYLQGKQYKSNTIATYKNF